MAIKSKHKPNDLSARKRSGQHHHHGKNYLKTYWPYLPLLAIIGVGLLVNGYWENHLRSVQGYAVDISPTSLLNDTNSNRLDHNETKLTLNSKLASAAQAKANNMVQLNYWSHVTPTGVQPWQFITAQGYNYQAAGENLAYGFGNSGAVLTAWMNSPEHRANILDNNYQNVGFGIANSPDFQGNGPTTLVVAMYGEPATLSSVVSQSSDHPTVNIASDTSAQTISRIQLLSGGAKWSLFLVIFLVSATILIFILRHGLAFRRFVLEGEELVLKHRYLDVAIISLAVAGIILVQTAGSIH